MGFGALSSTYLIAAATFLAAPSLPTVPKEVLVGGITISAEDYGKLLQGEVIVTEQVVERDGKKNLAMGLVVDPAPADKVWEVLTDFNAHARFVPGVEESRIIIQKPDEYIVVRKVKVLFVTTAYTVRFIRDQTAGTLNFSMVRDRELGPDLKKSGAARSRLIRDTFGSYLVCSIGDGDRTLVIYQLYIDQGGVVPQFLVRRVIKRELPKILKAVRQEIEARK